MVVAKIRIAPELASQLSKENGSPGNDQQRTTTPPGSAFTPLQQDSQTRAAARKSKELQSALITSESIGGLLLKNEETEVVKVNERASALISSGACQAKRDAPCAHERVAVLNCYKNHSGNELVCASLVSAYQLCSSTEFRNRN